GLQKRTRRATPRRLLAAPRRTGRPKEAEDTWRTHPRNDHPVRQRNDHRVRQRRRHGAWLPAGEDGGPSREESDERCGRQPSHHPGNTDVAPEPGIQADPLPGGLLPRCYQSFRYQADTWHPSLSRTPWYRTAMGRLGPAQVVGPGKVAFGNPSQTTPR